MNLPVWPSSPSRRRPKGPLLGVLDRGLATAGRRCATRIVLFAACAALLFTTPGCGTREYQRGMEEHLVAQQQKTALAAAGFGSAQQIGETRVWVHLPTKLGNFYCKNGKTADGMEPDLRRAEPWEFGKLSTLPPRNVTFEGMLAEMNGNQKPCYCYLGVKEIAGGSDLAKMAAEIRQEMANVANMDTISEVTDFQSEPASRTPWKKIRWDGKQEFYCKSKDGKESFVTLPGAFEAYLHEEAGLLIMVAGRVPHVVEKDMTTTIGSDMAKLAALITGSVSVKR